jgi:hypothetical protein
LFTLGLFFSIPPAWAAPTQPILTANHSPVTYSAGGAAVSIDSALQLSDDASTNQLGATVSISSGLLPGDTLNFTDEKGIRGSYDGLTGVLTLSGKAGGADYQAALDSITFSFSAPDPTKGGTNLGRTFSWQVQGVASDSDPVTSNLKVDAPPVVTAGAMVTVTKKGALVAADGTLTVLDAESNTLTGASVSFTSGFLQGDPLNFTEQNGISGNYDSLNGVLTLSGAPARPVIRRPWSRSPSVPPFQTPRNAAPT